jgi:hypothetical protein
MERNLESLKQRAEILAILAPLTATGSNKAQAAAERLIGELDSLDDESEPRTAISKPNGTVLITMAKLDELILDARRLKMIEKHSIRVYKLAFSKNGLPWCAERVHEAAVQKGYATFTEALDAAIARAEAATPEGS